MIHRRQALVLAAGSACCSLPALGHNSVGFVNPPLKPPTTAVQLQDGKSSQLAAVFDGRVTALQLMFTGCSATCPIQGALFASVQEKLAKVRADLPHAQLISFSIDPLRDGPAQLRQWLKGFEASKQWSAVTPDTKALDPFLDFLQGRANNNDRHTGQVYFFDPRGHLVLRTVDFPQSDLVVSRLIELSAKR